MLIACAYGKTYYEPLIKNAYFGTEIIVLKLFIFNCGSKSSHILIS